MWNGYGFFKKKKKILKVFFWKVLTPNFVSPRAHLQVVEMLWFIVFDKNQQSLPTAFYSVLVSNSLFMALSTVFHSINSPDNSPLSHSVLPVLFLP